MKSETRPRVLIVGRSEFSSEPSDADIARWNVLSEYLDFRFLSGGSRPSDDPRFRLLPIDRASIGFYGHLTFASARELREWSPQVIMATRPYDAACVLLSRIIARRFVPVVTEVHGDWRTASRLYGGRARRVLAPFADATASIALRASTGTRALSRYTGSLAYEATGKQPLGLVPAFFDAGTFFAVPPTPVPERPRLLFIGTLQACKNIGFICSAWRAVASHIPDAELVIVGDGPLRHEVEDLVRLTPGQVDYHPYLEPAKIAEMLDAARALVLLSHSEGFPRVVMEAFARGRSVIGARAGGIVDLVDDGRNGLLVDTDDLTPAVQAMLDLLQDHDLAVRLGHQAGLDAESLCPSPDRWAQGIRGIVDAALAQTSIGSKQVG